MPSRTLSVAALSILCACAAAQERSAPVLSSDGPSLDAVARLGGSTACSGVLIAPTKVLTAAHCVAGLTALPTVHLGPSSAPVRAEVSRCAMHPQAYDGAIECSTPMERSRVERINYAADLAVLTLSAPVDPRVARPLDVMLECARPESLNNAEVRVTGWLSDEVSGGPVGRCDGVNRVVMVGEHTLATEPSATNGRHGFSTQPGDSGGPCLLSQGGQLRIVGVLSGGSSAYSSDSVYSATFRAPNAEWIRSSLTNAQ